jgi:hypothetical protein
MKIGHPYDASSVPSPGTRLVYKLKIRKSGGHQAGNEIFMSKSPTKKWAGDDAEDDRAWALGEAATSWQLRLSLPPGASPQAIPGDLQALLASLFDAILHRHALGSAQRPVTSVRWRARAGSAHPRAIPDYWKALQAILERFWGTHVHLELVAPDALPRVSFESPAAAGEHGDARARATAAPPFSAPVVAFTPDIDSLAAVSRVLDSRQEPPVLVLCEAVAEVRAASRQTLTGLLDACRSRLATMAVLAPGPHARMRDAATLPFPEDWRLLHVLAAVSVALSCDVGEIQVPQNGIANLNLPVTAAALARPAHPIDPELAGSLSRLLSRVAGAEVRIHNPLVSDTPSEIVADLLERRSRQIGVDIESICGLVENDNDYGKRVDHHVSILGALHAGSSLTEQWERALMTDLLLPTNQALADTYVQSIRELPAMSDREVLLHLDESAAGRTASRDRHALAIGLLRRHAESVRDVLARALQRYAPDIVAGTLSSTCLLMRAALPGDLRPRTSAARRPAFRKLEKVPDCWEIWFEEGEPLYLKGSRGLDYIHVLLQSPGRTFSPADLRDAVAGQVRIPTSNLGPVADAQAVRSYQRRLTELRADLDVATEHNDLGRCDRILYEIEVLEQEINRCVGLGGRLRQNSDAERARKSVSNAIHRALGQLRAGHPALSRHLRGSLKLGNGMSYLPDDEIEWDT